MDLDDSTDTDMHNGDIIASTELHLQLTQTTTDSPIKLEFDDAVPSTTDLKPFSKPAKSPLKGSGARRQAGSGLFDNHLTVRKDDIRPPRYQDLPYASSQTGLVYDVRMRFHVEPVPTEDDVHPEDPRRLPAIFEAFVAAGLAWAFDTEGPSNDYYMGRIAARQVTKEEVCLVHTEKHWNWVQSIVNFTEEELKYYGRSMDSVFLSANTPYCAALSAGGAIEACRAVLLGKVRNAFAVIRPPGHHAEREEIKGFCFFDNVSIATKVCQQEFGERCRKVFILDWDVHHGNGIQQATYDDPNVLYISLHVHERGRFYPEGSYSDGRGPFGDHLHCGAGAGLGRNVNIPWTRKGMGDADYIYAFQQIVMPIATEFTPDLVIIAAGFDAADGDMLGGCHVTPAGYAHMTHMLMSLAHGRLVVCLEGGYNLHSIADSATAVGRTLMGEPPERLLNTSPTSIGVDDVKLVLRQQSRFWSCLYPKDPAARLAGPLHGERMHDIVRRWQATTLWDEYEMSPLYVYREQVSKTFENEVLATPNYAEARPLLVIMHDPPEVIASPDPRTGKIELHNTWLTDIVKTYVDWAVKHGFGVIDVNLPRHVTEFDDTQEHKETDSIDHRKKEATELLTYLWDNYVELNESTHVFMLGTNIGHGAIINFIKANEERVQERLTSAISFVEDVPLQSCKSATNDLLDQWYYNASLVFVTPEHNIWNTDMARNGKIKKRFGKVTNSSAESVTDMLIEHKNVVFDLLSAETANWRAENHEDDNDVMDTDVAAPVASPRKLPPVSNFALSPAPKGSSAAKSPTFPPSSNFASPRSRQARSPRTGTPPRMPPIGNFALSPGQRPSRSPAR